MFLCCVCQHLTGCLDAENGHPCLWLTLEFVNQLDSVGGWDAAVDADITGLEQRPDNELEGGGEVCHAPDALSKPDSDACAQLCADDETPAAQKSLNKMLFFRIISFVQRRKKNSFKAALLHIFPVNKGSSKHV